MLDLLVIGAGLSGLTAALAAARLGLRVQVVAKGLGAHHWGAGTLDLLGYLPGENAPVANPLAALEQLPDEHPLRQVGQTAVQAALADLQTQLAQAGLAYVGHAEGHNLHLPSAVGSARPAYLAPAAQAGGRLDDPAPMLLIGFARQRDFYPMLMAENLRRQGHPARAATLPLHLLTDRRDNFAPYLAKMVEEPKHRDALAQALRQLVQPGERIGLPALLGVDNHPHLWQQLQQTVGAPIFEIPSLPPSVPGMRLYRAYIGLLQELGVRVEAKMTAIEFGAQGHELQWVATESTARPLRHYARAYLLATGGILGGGITADHAGRCRETLFGLPLTVPAAREDWFHPHFLAPTGQPIFQGGVAVNGNFQPCDGASAPCYGNLWAAGNLLAHADTIQTRSREGVAIATATAAARAIHNYLKQPASAVTLA